MFLLVPAHPCSPGQNPESCKMVVAAAAVKLCFSAEFFHFSEPNLQDVPTQTGEIVMDICRIGVSFIGRS